MSSKKEIVQTRFVASPTDELVTERIESSEPCVRVFCYYYVSEHLNIANIDRRRALMQEVFEGRGRRIFWDESLLPGGRKYSDALSRYVSQNGLLHCALKEELDGKSEDEVAGLSEIIRKYNRNEILNSPLVPQPRGEFAFAKVFDELAQQEPISYMLEYHSEATRRAVSNGFIDVKQHREKALEAWQKGDFRLAEVLAESSFKKINSVMDARNSSNVWQMRDLVRDCLAKKETAGIFINHQGPKLTLTDELVDIFKDQPRVRVDQFVDPGMEHWDDLYRGLSLVTPDFEIKKKTLSSFMQYRSMVLLNDRVAWDKEEWDGFIAEEYPAIGKEMALFWQGIERAEIEELCKQRGDTLDFVKTHERRFKFPALTLGLL